MNIFSKESIDEFVENYKESTYTKSVLFALSFAESSFFPVPPDILLLAIIMTKVKKWWVYAGITTVASVLGGIFGYVIGFFLLDTVGSFIIETYHLQDEFIVVENWFDKNTFLAIFISGFTIIPYKIFTISAGIFHVNILTFVTASIISRAARYYLLAYIADKFGHKFKDALYRYFNIGTILVVILVVIILLIVAY
jgi:membrane protein YqaA with SNARE-associated domain